MLPSRARLFDGIGMRGSVALARLRTAAFPLLFAYGADCYLHRGFAYRDLLLFLPASQKPAAPIRPAKVQHVPSNVEVAALTDIGCVRKNNEDSFGYDSAAGIYVVCDGMGGMAAGEVASSLACSTTIAAFAAQPEEMPVRSRLEQAMRSANDAVCLASQEQGQHGMGTTLVGAVLKGARLLIANVGDSRAYLLQDGAWEQVTMDHSYINELVRQGTVKPEDIHTVDLRGMEAVITRAIGASDNLVPDFYSVDLEDNDVLLLASDGLTRYLGSSDFAALVDPADLPGSCERLIHAARKAGGADNITCLLLRYRA